jgi:hypothetical protein
MGIAFRPLGRLLAVLLLLGLHPLPASTLPFRLENRTEGPLAARPAFLTVTALDTAGRFERMDASGAFHLCSIRDNRIPRNGTTWCAYSFPLADFDMDVARPVISGRLYLSVGSPLLLRVDPATGGLVQPDPANPQDPNRTVPFDWVEFTVDAAGFHGNTTCVDQWCLPIRLEVLDRMGRTAGPVGLTDSRRELLGAWRREVPEPFRDLAGGGGWRILAPGHAPADGPLATSLDPFLQAFWRRCRTVPLAVPVGADTFTGRVGPDGALAFTREGDPRTYRIEGCPTTLETFRCDGVLARGDPVERALGARLGALLNRHPADPWDPGPSYETPCNAYAAFWHRHSLEGLAYGFPYDDVDGQATLLTVEEPAEVHIAFRMD